MKRTEAEALFRKQAEKKHGQWVLHSRKAAEAAELIAAGTGLDQDASFSIGLLHDIGRSLTDGQFRHIARGYEFMDELHHPEIARICLTHSFPVQNIHSYAGEIDVSEEEEQHYSDLLSAITYDAYDRLIQLCDAISVPSGWIPVEERQEGLLKKYGVNPYAEEKLKILQNLYAETSSRLSMDLLRYLSLHAY